MSQENSTPKDPRRFSTNIMAVLEKSDQEQKGLRDFVNSHGRFSEEEKSTLQLDSVSAFDRTWEVTLNAKGKFETSHEHGVGLISQGLQNSATTACDILHHVEPILQLVKEFGAPYGGMAIGTISFLFTVRMVEAVSNLSYLNKDVQIARNRAKMESDISDTLLQIRDRVAGLKLYRHIYNDDHELDYQLQSKIVHTYDSFISFCIAASKYYSRGSMRRWVKALWGSSATLNACALKVQKDIVDVRYMGEELLNKNVDTMKKQLVSQTQLITRLEENMKKLRDERNSSRLLEIKALLSLEGYSMEHEHELLQKYQDDFKVHSEYDWTDLESMQGSRLRQFQNHPDFQAWRDSLHSCMLVLVGYNDESFHRDRYCWLSSIALDMIESFRKSEQSDPYTFCVVGLQEPSLLPPVLSRIIIQLLMLNPQVLQNEQQYAELYAEIEGYRKMAEAEQGNHNEQEYSNTTNTLLQKVALRVLNMFDQTKPVWIILDRVDRCKSDANNHRKRLMKTLVQLVEKAAIKVRVLAVVSGHDWPADQVSDEFEQSRHENVIIHIARQQNAN